MRRDVFQAIADPTRRQIINMISQQSLNVNSVAENFNVSRTAVYKHIKILTECGLIVVKQHGRERFCEARLEKLGEVSDWVEQYRKAWAARFDNLEDYLRELQAGDLKPAAVKAGKSDARGLKSEKLKSVKLQAGKLKIKNKRHGGKK